MNGVGICSALAAVLMALGPVAFARWPEQAPYQIAHLGDQQLESSGVITNFKMPYVTHGRLNTTKDNAILFMHSFGLNHHQADHLIGPGRPLDTDKTHVAGLETTFSRAAVRESRGARGAHERSKRRAR